MTSILFLLFHATATMELIHQIDGIGLFARHIRFCPVYLSLMPRIVADANGAEVALIVAGVGAAA